MFYEGLFTHHSGVNCGDSLGICHFHNVSFNGHSLKPMSADAEVPRHWHLNCRCAAENKANSRCLLTMNSVMRYRTTIDLPDLQDYRNYYMFDGLFKGLQSSQRLVNKY